MLPHQKIIERAAGVGIIVLLLIGCLLVLLPFVSALLWSAILCLATWPLYELLLRKLRGRRTLAAALMTLALVLILFLPFFFLGLSFADNIRDGLHWINTQGSAFINGPAPDWMTSLPFFGDRLAAGWAEFGENSERVWKLLKPWLNQAGTWILQHTLSLAQGLFMMGIGLLVTFFFYRDGLSVVEQIRGGFGQLIGETGQRLLDVAAKTVRSVVYGVIGTGLAQAIVAWIGLFIAGVPGAPLLGMLTFFLSIIPVGPPVVWVSSSLWLFGQGHPGWGFFMLVYGFFGISGIDNFVKPYLISVGSRLPFILMLMGVLGGMVAFGFIGVFIGPTLLAVGHSLLKELRWLDRSRVTSKQ